MALQNLLNLSKDRTKIGLSEERVNNIIPSARQFISFWREYPDLFIDFLLRAGNPQNFKFYFYQRVKKAPIFREEYSKGV